MDPISIAWGLSQYAPSIIRWLSGSDKAADVAKDVVDLAKKVTGKSTGEEALEAIKADPNKVLEFQQAMSGIEADLDKAYLVDRQDARKRDVDLAVAGFRNKRADFMVLLDVLGLLAGLAGMTALGYFKARYPEEINDGVFGALLAQLSTITSYFGLCLRDAHQFEFGSSRGSRIKDERPVQVTLGK